MKRLLNILQTVAIVYLILAALFAIAVGLYIVMQGLFAMLADAEMCRACLYVLIGCMVSVTLIMIKPLR